MCDGDAIYANGCMCILDSYWFSVEVSFKVPVIVGGSTSHVKYCLSDNKQDRNLVSSGKLLSGMHRFMG